MPEITQAILAAADEVDRDLDALNMSTRTLLSLLRAGDTQPPGGGGGPAVYDQYGMPTVGTLGNTSSTVQVGWEFTVGASDIEVGKLRVQVGHETVEETIRIWRVSDSALVASAAVMPVTNTWVEVDLGAPVTLAAGANYIVSTRATGGSSRPYRFKNTNVDGFAFAPEVTYVTARFLASDAFPTSTLAGMFGLADIVFAAP